MSHAATHAVDRLHEDNAFSGSVRDRLKRSFRQQTDEAWAAMEELTSQHPDLIKADVQLVQLTIAEEQKVALYEMVRRGTLSEEIYVDLSAEIDQRISEVYSDEWEIPPGAVPEARGPGRLTEGQVAEEEA